MTLLFRLSSYLFHPIWMPFLGTLFYFLVTPRFFPRQVVEAKLLAVCIMTIFIPIVFYFMLRNLGRARSIFLELPQERVLPLLFTTALNVVILKFVFNAFDYPELYYFFFGILISGILGLLFLLLKQKVSLHMIGLGGITTFIALLGIHFNLDLTYTVSFLVIATGLTGSSRLYYDAHTGLELLMGLITGILPQLVLGVIWLE